MDKEKSSTIEKLPPLGSVKEIRSFLGHAGFYRSFIKKISKIARPLTRPLEKNPFEFNNECMKAFIKLKKKLIEAPIMIAPNWISPFKLVCDASDFVVGIALGQ